MLKKLGINLNKGDGKFSAQVFNKLELTRNFKGKTNGAKYEGVKIINLKGKRVVLSGDKTKKSTVNEFNELVEKAKIEHSKTSAALVEEKLEEENLDAPNELVNSIVSNSLERIDSEISDRVDDIINDVSLTNTELREFRGIVAVNENSGEEKIRDLDKEKAYWKELAEKERDAGRVERADEHEKKALLYDTVSDVAELKTDQIRLRLNQRPQGERALNIMKENINANDLTKLERLEKWAKENLGSISAITISVAGIITTIIVGARSAIAKGARATSNFAKAMANLAKKLGPVLGALLNIVAQVLTLGAKGLAFLSKNLWILAIALAYFLYNEIKKRKKFSII